MRRSLYLMREQDTYTKKSKPGPELGREAAALKLYAGGGAVKLIKADLDAGILYLEKAVPGDLLSTVVAAGRDDEATGIAAAVMKSLWRPVPKKALFPTIEEWTEPLLRPAPRVIPPALLDRARGLRADLLTSQAAAVLLHGDLHHDNILKATREPWLAIDPKGIIGEPCFDTGPVLRNANPNRRRVELLSDHLGFDRARVRAWAFVQAVLAAIWEWEDTGEGHERWLAAATILQV